MEANGLSKSLPPSFYLGCGIFRRKTMQVDDVMTDNETSVAVTPDRTEGHAIGTKIHEPMCTSAVPITATITPTSSRDNSSHSRDDRGNHHDASSFLSYPSYYAAGSYSTVLKGVCDNVTLAQARIRDIEERIANCSKLGSHQMQERTSASGLQQRESLVLLQNQLVVEKVSLIDALAIMGWEHYRHILEESSSYEKAEASVRHIYEEALDVSIQLFCSSKPGHSISTTINERLMILLLVLDFDEYCETLLHYQLALENMSTHPLSDTNDADRSMVEILNPSRKGDDYLKQLYELWMSGQFDHFDPTGSEEENDFAKIHAAGLCLVLFRKLESQVDRHQTDLNTRERQFRYLFDEYLPKQLSQPSMNNIVATKHAGVLFQDGNPTVYWSLLADSYRKDWGEHFDQEIMSCNSRDDESTDMDTDDDEDDGL